MDVQSLLQQETPKLRNCVHCGLCLNVCPTYRISGNENNSPRGRLAMWRALDEGRLEHDTQSDFYTSECVGCLACETACPANVPYGEILHEARETRTLQTGVIHPVTRWATRMAANNLFSRTAGLLLRSVRKLGLPPLPGGSPAVLTSTAHYAASLQSDLPEDAPHVALFTGCVGDSVFREINFATVRALTRNGVRVSVPDLQSCCGALHEHAGLPGAKQLAQSNQSTFEDGPYDAVITNSAGCNLTLSRTLSKPVEDAVYYLNRLGLATIEVTLADRIYLDLPCHLYHGRGITAAPEAVMNALQTPWERVPEVEYCCGAGGVYQLEKKDNAANIMESRHDFLRNIPEKRAIIATMNHVCLMQWDRTVRALGLQNRITVRHLITLLQYPDES